MDDLGFWTRTPCAPASTQPPLSLIASPTDEPGAEWRRRMSPGKRQGRRVLGLGLSLVEATAAQLEPRKQSYRSQKLLSEKL